MPVSGVSSSQQTGATTPPVKGSTQGPTSQRRTTDTLEGKKASSSCSFRYCFTRVYDFFCALFRCLFCIKNKPEEKKPNEKPAETKNDKPDAQPRTPIEQAYAFWDENDVKKEETRLAFQKLSPEVRSNVLGIVKAKANPVFCEYVELDKEVTAGPKDGQIQTQRSEPLPVPGGTEAPKPTLKIDQSPAEPEKQQPIKKDPVEPKKQQPIKNDLVAPKNRNTQFAPRPLSKDPEDDACSFMRRYFCTGFPHFSEGERGIGRARLVAYIAQFAEYQYDPKVQDEILRRITNCDLNDVLEKYLTEECLGEDRLWAFEAQYGSPYFKEQFSKKKLCNIFDKGFGSTATQPQPAKVEEPPKPQAQMLGPEAQDFVERFGLNKDTQLRDIVLQQKGPLDVFREDLTRAAREQVLNYIKVHSSAMYPTYFNLHEVVVEYGDKLYGIDVRSDGSKKQFVLKNPAV